MRSDEPSQVFEAAAQLFGLLSAPMRLRVMCELCDGELNVSDLLARIETTQPNMSQHLSTLYRAGVLDRRREGTQVFYRVRSERLLAVCRAVCEDLAMERPSDEPAVPQLRGAAF
jgi:ArsR family transcriptional regulator